MSGRREGHKHPSPSDRRPRFYDHAAEEQDDETEAEELGDYDEGAEP